MWKSLETVRNLEKKIGELYRCFADEFKPDPEAAALFSRLAREEDKHCGIIDFEIRVIVKDKSLPEVAGFDRERLRLESARVDELLQCRGLSLAEAVANAFRLEQTTAESYYRVQAVNNLPSLAPLVRTMGRGDQEHYEQLAAFARRRGFPPAPPWSIEIE